MSHRTLHATNPKSHCKDKSATFSPIIVPASKNCTSCSLTCQIKFDYARLDGWDMSIVRVVDDTFQVDGKDRSILRFYVDNFSTRPFRDITFTGNDYQLEFIEFYLPAIHTMPKDTDDGDDTSDTHENTESNVRYPMEMVLCHRVVDDGATATKWLNVSVFVESQTSYSLTNTFFYQLINTVLVSPESDSNTIYNSAHLSDDSNKYMPNIDWTTPVLKDSRQRAVNREGRTNGSPAIRIDVGKNWTPYHALPANKAFYSYIGEFVYAPCKYDANDEVIWVIMEQPVSIHRSEFEVLRAVVESNTNHRYSYNNGHNYTAMAIVPSHGRDVMYNNGELVVGNQDQDKFIIKCVKREDAAKAQRAYKRGRDEERASQDQVSVESKSAMYTTFQPPMSPMSAIVFCVLISVVLFAVFASSNWMHQAVGEMADKTKNVQYGMIVMICIALFVLYGLSFALASAVVGSQPLGIFVSAMILMVWTAYPMKFLMRKSAEWYATGKMGWKIGSWLIYVGTIFLWFFCFIIPGFSTAFAPLYYLNGSVLPTYKYYFKTEGSDTQTVYIGKKATMVINFAGYRLNYYNENTKIFDDNYMPLPNDFFDLYGHLRAKTVVTDPTRKREGYTEYYRQSDNAELFENALPQDVVLEKYNTFMQDNHTKPLDNLVAAVVETLAENDNAERIINETKFGMTGRWLSKSEMNDYKADVTLIIDNINAFKTSLRQKHPDFYAFMLKPPIN